MDAPEILPGLPVPEEPKPQPDRPLIDEINEVIMLHYPSPLAEGDQRVAAVKEQAGAVMALLMERGHFLPGAPPAARILADAKSFAERLTLSNLALRCFAMLGALMVDTPETKPAKHWIVDYIDGKNHGPVGAPMLWPTHLPGMAKMLTDWGFEPTPTTPAYVARALPHPAMQ